MRDYTSSIGKYTASVKGKDCTRWRVQYRYTDKTGNRKTTSKKGFETKGSAKEWERDELPILIHQLTKNKLPIEEWKFSELIEEYIKSSNNTKREDTCENIKYMLGSKIPKEMLCMRVGDITPNDIRLWQEGLLTARKKDGTKYADTYLRSIASRMAAVLNFANINFQLQSPMKNIKKIGSKEASTEKTVWTKDEYESFVKTIEHDPELYYAIQTMFWLGLRRSEMYGLTLNDIDFVKGTVSVNKGCVKNVMDDTKTKSSLRIIHMPAFLAQEIREYTNSIYGLKNWQRIFTVSPKKITKALTEGAEACGLKRITCHCLRHSHITMLNSMGILLTDIAKRAGHSTIDMTYHYSHQYENTDEEIAEKLERGHS